MMGVPGPDDGLPGVEGVYLVTKQENQMVSSMKVIALFDFIGH